MNAQPTPDRHKSQELPQSAACGLAARGLACTRGRRQLFCGLDIDLPPSRMVWLHGRNGSGKTSLLRILAGLSSPAEGAVTWNGQPLGLARADLHYIAHTNALNDDLTLTEALTFLAQLQGLADGVARSRAALDRMGLASRRDAPVRTLSQGQRRRGALARLALDEAPRSWLLDEPFDALDSDSAASLAMLIQAHAARGGAVLLTSHQALSWPGLESFDLAEPAA